MPGVGTSGKVLRFSSGFAHGSMIEWDAAQACSFKQMPDKTVCLLIEGWGKPADNKFDHVELENNPSLKRTPLEPDVQEFLVAHDLLEEYATLVTSMKEAGSELTDQRLGALCFGDRSSEGFSPLFEAKGVRLFICKTLVNAGEEPSKEFMWLEFSAHPTYVPETGQLFRKRDEDAGMLSMCIVG
jgi:hypothetical protein